MSHPHSPVAARKRLLTVEEVADMLQVPKSWVYARTRRRGLEQLPHLKVGKYLRFEEGTMREFVERLKVGAPWNA
jgi:excisionase family DNA binding protein